MVLKALTAANLVRDEPRGTARIYRIHPPALVELRAWLDSFWGSVLDSFKDHVEEDYECRGTRSDH